MLSNYRRHLGSLLADEMGLGKTLQVINLILQVLDEARNILVVCPATLCEQWYDEFLLERPDESLVEILDGRRQKVDAPIAIASYEYVRTHIKAFQRKQYDLCVLDEGHRIRNANSQLTMCLKTLNVQRGGRVLMTGTPLQNGLREFWTLIDFVEPGLLGTLPVFNKYFVHPIESGGGTECLAILKRLIKPHILRRTKASLVAQGVLELPDKKEQVIKCPLTRSQYQIYSHFLDVTQPIRKLARSNVGGFVLMYMTVLLKICNHPDILLKDEEKRPADFGTPTRSGKLHVLIQLLRTWRRNKNRVLIFSQRIQTLNIIQMAIERMDSEAVEPSDTLPEEGEAEAGLRLNCDFLRLDGTVPTRQRMSLIDSFNENTRYFCMLLTTRVGGVGINLTGADRVVLFDPDWNPSVDSQAQERCWRIGQMNKDVKVYRLICSNTLEQFIYERQLQKVHMASRVLKSHDGVLLSKSDFISAFAQPPEPNGGEPLSDQLFKLFKEVLRAQDNSLNLTVKTTTSTKKNAKRSAVPEEAAFILPGADDSSEEEVSSSSKRARSEDVQDNELSLLEELCEVGAIDVVESHEDKLNASALPDISRESVAWRAYDALKKSSMACRAVPINVPTWTGSKGEAGKPALQKLSKVTRNEHLKRALKEVAGEGTLRTEADEEAFIELYNMLEESLEGVTLEEVRRSVEEWLWIDKVKTWLTTLLAREIPGGRWILREDVEEVVERNLSNTLEKYGLKPSCSSERATPSVENDDDGFF